MMLLPFLSVCLFFHYLFFRFIYSTSLHIAISAPR